MTKDTWTVKLRAAHTARASPRALRKAEWPPKRSSRGCAEASATFSTPWRAPRPARSAGLTRPLATVLASSLLPEPPRRKPCPYTRLCGKAGRGEPKKEPPPGASLGHESPEHPGLHWEQPLLRSAAGEAPTLDFREHGKAQWPSHGFGGPTFRPTSVQVDAKRSSCAYMLAMQSQLVNTWGGRPQDLLLPCARQRPVGLRDHPERLLLGGRSAPRSGDAEVAGEAGGEVTRRRGAVEPLEERHPRARQASLGQNPPREGGGGKAPEA